jgi:hypothetical protein
MIVKMLKYRSSVAARFLQVTLWLIIIIFVSAYTANFASDQIVDLITDSNEKELPIKNIEELVDQDKINYGILKTGSTFRYFNVSDLTFA